MTHSILSQELFSFRFWSLFEHPEGERNSQLSVPCVAMSLMVRVRKALQQRFFIMERASFTLKNVKILSAASVLLEKRQVNCFDIAFSFSLFHFTLQHPFPSCSAIYIKI